MFSSKVTFLAIAALAIASSCKLMQSAALSLAPRDVCRHLITLKFNHGCKANKFIAEFQGNNKINYIYNPFLHLQQEPDASICVDEEVVEGPFGAIAGDHESKVMDLESLYVKFEPVNSAFAFKKYNKDGRFLKVSPANITRAHFADRTGTTLTDLIYFDSDITGTSVDADLLQKGQFTDLIIEFC